MAITSSPSQLIPIPLDLRKELPDPLTPWHLSQRLFKDLQSDSPSQLYKKAQVLPTDPEWRFVWRCFHHNKPTNYCIKRIYCIHERHQAKAFELNLSSMEREGEIFKATWNQEPRAEQRAAVIERWKQVTGIFSPFQTVENDGRKRTWNQTKVLPLWHGSSFEKCDSISTSGFVYFGKTSLGSKNSSDPQSTDEGYFGSGIYFTSSARYASDIYSKGHLLMAWVSMREPFPVVGDPKQLDMDTLKGRGAYKSYNAHYVPVVPINSDPECPVYHPCKKGETPTCDELVVFHKSQALPRFWVELEVELPHLMQPSDVPLFVSELIPYLLKILQNASVDRDQKLRNILGGELAVLLKMKEDDDLEQRHGELFKELIQLIDSDGKVNKAVRQTLTSTPALDKIPSSSAVSPPTLFKPLFHPSSPNKAEEVPEINVFPQAPSPKIKQLAESATPLRNWRAKPQVQTIQGHTKEVTTLIELKDGMLASGSGDNTINLWKRDGTCLATFTGHTNDVWTLIELKDGMLASGSADSTIKLWKRDGTCLATFTGHTDPVHTLIELKDGTLASGSGDNTIKLWKRNGTCLATFTGHTQYVWTLIELKDGTLASGSWDYTIKLWKRDGTCLATFTGHTDWVHTLIELKDGTLASGSQDDTIKLWKRDGTCLATFTGHTRWVRTLIELKDGMLASGSSDKTIKLWKRDGTCLATWKGHTHEVTTLIELKDGTLASGSWDKTLKLWTFPLMK